jgi:DNA-binding MarR family transcriptional regulator
MENQLLSLLSDLGLKPTEVLILGLLWQNMKSFSSILNKLTEKISQMEYRLDELHKKVES